jgi:hypothetical protein
MNDWLGFDGYKGCLSSPSDTNRPRFRVWDSWATERLARARRGSNGHDAWWCVQVMRAVHTGLVTIAAGCVAVRLRYLNCDYRVARASGLRIVVCSYSSDSVGRWFLFRYADEGLHRGSLTSSGRFWSYISLYAFIDRQSQR